MQRVADECQAGDEHLDEFDRLRHPRLVIAVGDFAAQAGKEEIGRDENSAGERDERFGVGAAAAEQDQEDQRGFEKIVVECREELAGEQRRKAPRQNQGRRHCA